MQLIVTVPSSSAPARAQSSTSSAGSGGGRSSGGCGGESNNMGGGGSSGGGSFGRSGGPPPSGGGSFSIGGNNNSDFRDGLKLRTELSFKEAGLLDQSRNLTAKALECVTDKNFRLLEGKKLNNPEVIRELTKNGEPMENWGKYRTNPVTLNTGQVADIHFYYNHVTGEVKYGCDFKVKQPVGLFTTTQPPREPTSKPYDPVPKYV